MIANRVRSLLAGGANVYTILPIDTLLHDSNYAFDNSLALIDTTHLILSYNGNTMDQTLKTFSIDSSADNITQIDENIADTARGQFNSIVKIDATHFIVAHCGNGEDGYIATVSIDGAYDNIAVILSIEHDTGYGAYNKLLKVDDTHFILAYDGGTGATIKTFVIDGEYGITAVDSLVHDVNGGWYQAFEQIDSTHYLLVYGNMSTLYDAYVKTFSIDANADNITELHVMTYDDATESDMNNLQNATLCRIDATHLLLACCMWDYTLEDWGGYIKVLTVDGSYNISELVSYKHHAGGTLGNSMVNIQDMDYVLAFSNSDTSGFLKTFTLSETYAILEGLTPYTFTTQTFYENCIIAVDTTHYALAYAEAINKAYLATFSVVKT
jgi:hypothetical protein